MTASKDSNVKTARVLPFAVNWTGEGPKQFDHWQHAWQSWADTLGEFWTSQQEQMNSTMSLINQEMAAVPTARDPRDMAHRMLKVQRHAYQNWLKSVRKLNDHWAGCCFETAGYTCDLVPPESPFQMPKAG